MKTVYIVQAKTVLTCFQLSEPLFKENKAKLAKCLK